MAAPAALIAAPAVAGKLAYDKLQERKSKTQQQQIGSDELESNVVTRLDKDTMRGGTIHARIVESGVTTTRISSFTVEVPGTGEEISLEDAVRRGLVSEETAQQYKEQVTTDKSIESLVVLIIDPSTGEEIVADEAIKRGIVTAEEVNEFIQMKDDKNRLSNYGSMSSVNTMGREGSHSRSQSRTESRAHSRASSRSRLAPHSSPSETSRESSVGSSVEVAGSSLKESSQFSSTLTVDVNRQNTNNYSQSERTIETKVLNLKQGYALSSLDEVRNLQTGESMSIYEAKLRGIATDVHSEATSASDCKSNMAAMIKEDVMVSKQTKITITEAFSRNLIDFGSNTFTNPANGQKMSIAEAANIGLLITDFKETVDETFIDIDADNVSVVDAFVHLFNEEQKVFERRVHDAALNTTTTREYTLQQAVDENWINGDDIILDIQSSDQFTLRQALDIKLVDGVTCEFTISETNEKIFLGDAAKQGKVAVISEAVMAARQKKNRPNYFGRKYALREAVDEGIYQHDTGLFFYQMTEEHVTIYEAISIGLIDAKSAEIKNTSNGVFNNLTQAMNSKILDKKTCRVKDIELNVELSVTDAYEKGLLRDVKKESSTSSTPSNFESINFWDAIENGQLDTQTGLFTSIHEEGKKLRLEEAVFRKYIDKKSAYVIDTWKRKHCSLSEATRKNMIKDGMIMNTTQGKLITIQEAINANIIIRDIKHLSIIDALDFGLYQPYSGRILVPGTERDISLTEAMDLKIIDHRKTIIKNQRLGRYISTLEAMRLNDIDGHTGMYGSMNLLEARSRGYILPSDAMVSRTVSGRAANLSWQIPLPAPSACGIINPFCCILICVVFYYILILILVW